MVSKWALAAYVEGDKEEENFLPIRDYNQIKFIDTKQDDFFG